MKKRKPQFTKKSIIRVFRFDVNIDLCIGYQIPVIFFLWQSTINFNIFCSFVGLIVRLIYSFKKRISTVPMISLIKFVTESKEGYIILNLTCVR